MKSIYRKLLLMICVLIFTIVPIIVASITLNMKSYFSVAFLLCIPIFIFPLYFFRFEKNKEIASYYAFTILLIVTCVFCCIYIHKLCVYSGKTSEVRNKNDLKENHHKVQFSSNFTFFKNQTKEKYGISLVPIFYSDTKVAYGYLYESKNWNDRKVGYLYPQLWPITEKLQKMNPENLPIYYYGDFPDTMPFVFSFISHFTLIVLFIFWIYRNDELRDGYQPIN